MFLDFIIFINFCATKWERIFINTRAMFNQATENQRSKTCSNNITSLKEENWNTIEEKRKKSQENLKKIKWNFLLNWKLNIEGRRDC